MDTIAQVRTTAPDNASQDVRARFDEIVRQRRCRQVARELGCSRSYVDMICSGDRTPGLRLVVEIERLYGIPRTAWIAQSQGGRSLLHDKPGTRSKARARLSQLVKKLGADEVARKVGCSRSYVDMLRSGERPRPGLRVAALIERALLIPMSWWCTTKRSSAPSED